MPQPFFSMFNTPLADITQMRQSGNLGLGNPFQGPQGTWTPPWARMPSQWVTSAPRNWTTYLNRPPDLNTLANVGAARGYDTPFPSAEQQAVIRSAAESGLNDPHPPPGMTPEQNMGLKWQAAIANATTARTPAPPVPTLPPPPPLSPTNITPANWSGSMGQLIDLVTGQTGYRPTSEEYQQAFDIGRQNLVQGMDPVTLVANLISIAQARVAAQQAAANVAPPSLPPVTTNWDASSASA